MAAQMRAYSKANRRPKFEPEVKAIADKVDEINKIVESIGLVEVMKSDRNRPLYEARDRVRRMRSELTAAEDHLRQVEAAGQVDVSDLDERQEKLRDALNRHRSELEAMVKKAVDTSVQEPS